MRELSIALAIVLACIGIAVIAFLETPDAQAGQPPQSATYVDMYDDLNNCSACHQENWDGWAQTKHAIAWPSLMSGFSLDPCEPCHATGAGVPNIYPATGYSPISNEPAYLQNVTCQACHGPASEHIVAPLLQKQTSIGLVLNASLCGACHYTPEGLGGSHHPTYNEWMVSGHNTSWTLPSYVKQVECSNCHEAWNALQYIESGWIHTTALRESGEDAPLTWDITCPTCHDPHSNGVAGTQLRVPADQICARCHNAGGALPGSSPHHPMAEMRNNTAGYGIDRTNLSYMPDVICADCHMATNFAGLPNHTFSPNPVACVACHPSTFPNVADATWFIDDIKSYTNNRLGLANTALGEASGVIEQMLGNRTAQDLGFWTSEYDIALFNYETVVSDRSSGNHNPYLTNVLLPDAENRSNEIIDALTPPDKVVILDVRETEPGKIEVTWANGTASDLAFFRIYLLPTDETNITSFTWEAQVMSSGPTVTWTLNATAGTWWVYVTAVDSNGNEITNTVRGTEVMVLNIAEFSSILIPTAGLVLIALVARLVSKGNGKRRP